MTDELLTPRRVADEYGFSVQCLANWRWKGEGPTYIKSKPGRSGRVFYRRSAVEEYLDANTVPAGGTA